MDSYPYISVSDDFSFWSGGRYHVFDSQDRKIAVCVCSLDAREMVRIIADQELEQRMQIKDGAYQHG